MQDIKAIKIMLLGITVILSVIVLHMFMYDGLTTDLIAIIGVIIVAIGYKKTNDDCKPTD